MTADVRADKGGAANRRLRRSGRVPGIVYGVGDPRLISVDHDQLRLDLSHEQFHSSVLSLDLGGERIPVLLREVQTHPVADQVVHVDFQAIAEDAQISMTVPLHFTNADTAPGVKLSHGVFSVIEAELGIHCLPRDLPEHIAVDVGHLEINNSIHLSEIKAPPGVSFDALARGEDPSLATVLAPQREEEEAAEAQAADELQKSDDEEQPKEGEG